MKYVFSFVLFVALTVGGLKSGAAQESVTVPTADDVINAIGFSGEQKAALLAGKIVTKDLKQMQKKEIVAAAAMRIPVPLDKIDAVYQEGSTIRADPDNIGFGSLKATFDENDWKNVRFDPDEKSEIKRILKAKPGSNLNLSAEEISKLSERLNGVKADQSDVVSSAYREILIGRFKAYLQDGLNGIAPYDRGKAEAASPAEEIRTAWEIENDFLEGHFPGFVRAFSDYPANQPPEIKHEYHWRKQKVEGRPAFILEHEMLQRGEGYILGAGAQFFVGHTYNSQVVVWLLLPHENDTLVFHANSTSTDAIAGFFSGVASSVGQDRMKESISTYFDALQKKAQ